MSEGSSSSSKPKANGSQSGEDLVKAKEILKAKFQLYFNLLLNGCGREFCPNKYCACCPYSEQFKSREEAAQRAIKLMGTKELVDDCPKTAIPPHSLNRESIAQVGKGLGVGKKLLAIFSKAPEAALTQWQQVFSSKFSLAISFRKHEKILGNFLRPIPDFDYDAFGDLVTLLKKNDSLHHKLLAALLNMTGKEWTEDLEAKSPIETALNLRLFLIVLEIPGIYDVKNMLLLSRVLDKSLALSQETADLLISWLNDYPQEHFQRLVANLRSVLAELIKKHQKDEKSMTKLCAVLDLLYRSNKQCRKVSYKEFYNDTVNKDGNYKKRQIKEWYINKVKGTHRFTVYDYAWMLDPESKYLMLSIENDLQQEEQVEDLANPDTLLNLLVHGGAAVSPYCNIEVRRENLIEDALNILSRPGMNFRKEIRVAFIGEQGVDYGGVRKEFFQLIVKQIFDPAYSMFRYNEETRTYWFDPDTFEPRIKFELIGFILGLALYNSVILDVHFPRVVYKKLLGYKPSFEDLMDFSPAIAQSLDFILKYDGKDLQDILSCTFSVDVESYGKKSTVDLKPGGSSIAVTQENKSEYVALYIEWLFDKSVEKLFSAFKNGFYKLYSGEMTTNCDPEELQLLICGSPALDFHELEKVTQYDGGYTKDSPTVLNLWSVIHELDLGQKKRFLFFTTGSDRAPVGGLGSLPFCVMKHGEDGDQLPSAHTCFNHLLLPPYKSREKLREKLLLAISNSEGFGLL